MKKRSRVIMLAVFAAVLILLGTFMFNAFKPKPTNVGWSVFKSYVENSDPNREEEPTDKDVIFVKVAVSGFTYFGYQAKKDSTGAPVIDEKTGKVVAETDYSYYTVGPSLYNSTEAGSILEKWGGYDIEIVFNDPDSGSLFSNIMSIASLVVMGFLVWMVFAQMGGAGKGAMSFGKTKAKITTNIKVRFSDVAGAEEEKVELQEITEFLKTPDKFSKLGARIPKGVLLVGPPGTGKTLFAKAVAGEAGVPFFSVSGSDFVEMYVGVGASRVRDLFEIAKKNQPCIIFIDEIDAVGRERGAGLGGGSDEREQTLNQILVQMDGFESNEAIIVMAATNRADILDPALMRPGRFDRKIMVNLPDVKGREAILKVHARNKPMAGNVNFKTLARITAGFSGADLENLLNEAAILAARADKTTIGNAEIYEGVNKVEMGPQKKSRVVTESDKRITAYHEAGHAILSMATEYGETVHEVTIIPRGGAAGYTMTRPESDDDHYSKNKLLDRICMMLGGRVAEELAIHDVCTGASNDLQRASSVARRMVTEWGMGEKVGLVSYGDGQPVFIGKQFGSSKEYGDKTASLIDDEIRDIIEGQHARAVKILTEKRSILDNMARVLVERDTIYTEEVKMLMNGASVAEVEEYMTAHDAEGDGNPFARFERKEDKEDVEPVAKVEVEPASSEEKKEEEKVDWQNYDPFGDNNKKDEE